MKVLHTTDVLVLGTGATFSTDPAFEGLAAYRRENYTWVAKVTPDGYVIEVTHCVSNRTLCVGTSATFNLATEVAYAVKLAFV